EIELGRDSLQRFPGILLSQYYKNNMELKQANLQMEKSRFFPELSAGYFNQDIKPNTGLNGWMVGISVPLWFLPQNARIQQAKVDYQIAGNEYRYQQFNINKEIENLLTELNKYYNQISYYEQDALVQADLLIKTATTQFEKESIEYFEYIQSIATAIQIKLDYLNVLNNYNQTAVQLEFYTN
ncbi:MAG TPA: TolC family protein, partial [Bacteroidales bacterium]|nr:TolC family protein [Bacteroidales bacterium]